MLNKNSVNKNLIPSEYLEVPTRLISARAMLGSAVQFLGLVETVLGETVKQKNTHWYFGDPITDQKFNRLTKWSDFNVIRPILFNFYHGLELLTKGLLLVSGQTIASNHELVTLSKKVSHIQDLPREIKDIFAKHIASDFLIEPIKSFITFNNMSITKLYEYLRYPTSKGNLIFTNYDSLEYQGEKILPYFKSVIIDSRILRVKAIDYFRLKSRRINK